MIENLNKLTPLSGGNGILRLKINKERHSSSDTAGFIHFDVGPQENPFEVARSMIHSLSPGDKWNICYISNSYGTIYNWTGIHTGDEVQLWAIDDFGRFAFHDDMELPTGETT